MSTPKQHELPSILIHKFEFYIKLYYPLFYTDILFLYS